MCGFVGTISWDDRLRIEPDDLHAMSRCIAHRGPDGHGWFVSDGLPQVAMAHHRLAVLDPDPHANQPFVSTDGQVSLVFNGEIYNFRELRKELTEALPDFQWRTDGDTEVLLAAYQAWGMQCVNRLNGMFAFAIYDATDQSLFVARDRMGQKPLFIAQARQLEIGSSAGAAPGAVAFASGIEAIRQLPWVRSGVHSETNRSSLTDYLLFGYVAGTRTVYQGISRLRPGTCARFTADGSQVWAYFDASAQFTTNDLDLPPGTVAERTRTLVERAVQRQLVSDVPLGCFLSGGIDSSIMASVMCRLLPADQPLHTFSIGFDDPQYDESPYAEQVARHLGTIHQTFRVTPDAMADLPRLARTFGEPFADSSALPTHYLSAATRRHVTVAISGDGGDELFAGYDRYRALLSAEALRDKPFARKLFASRLWRWLPGSHPKSRMAKFKRFAASVELPAAERYPSYMRLFSLDQIAELTGHASVATDPRRIGDRWFNAVMDDRELLQAALAADRVTYLPDDLLTKVDTASMLHALEVRSPFMDHELVAYAATLTTNDLLSQGPKTPLRQAFARDLPENVFTRRKMGFAVPIGQWFRTSLRPMLRDHLESSDSFTANQFNRKAITKLIGEHERLAVDHSQRLYALLMLELWHRQSRV